MKIDNYKNLLKFVLIREISFGSTTIRLFSENELNKAQIGYSIDPTGASLLGNEEGDWKENWFVIGKEDLCGDPLFIDLDVSGFPVLTAMHGVGNWNEQEVAESFDGFVNVFELVDKISNNRNTAVLLEQNPLSSKEKRTALEEIREIIPNSSTGFWENLLEIELWEANLPANHKPKLPK
jgi:hypothetical protein